MPVTMALAARINQAMMPVTCPSPKPRTTYSSRPPADGYSGTELGERVALQAGDRTGDQERQPHSGAGHFPSCAEQGEDPGAHHRADSDERRLAYAERSGGGFDAGHGHATAGSRPQ